MVGIILITHGDFGEYMLRAAQDIVGVQEGVKSISLQNNDSRETLRDRVKEAIAQLNTPDGVLILTDMAGGTPCNVALSLVPEINCEIVCGINLYMLVCTLTARTTLSMPDLVKKIVSAGKKNIIPLKEELMKECR